MCFWEDRDAREDQGHVSVSPPDGLARAGVGNVCALTGVSAQLRLGRKQHLLRARPLP